MEAQTLPYETFEEIYSRQLENDCYICLVYEINGEVIGCINLRMEYQLHHAGRICEIMELAVRSDRRSQGIGRCLFNAAYNEAKAQGCLQIEVCCNQLRLRTHRFYEVPTVSMKCAECITSTTSSHLALPKRVITTTNWGGKIIIFTPTIRSCFEFIVR